MKYFNYKTLIKRKDNKSLNTLKYNSKDIVIFKCEQCGEISEEKYSVIVYRIKTKGKTLCEKCVKENMKKLKSKQSKELWKNEEYKNKVSEKVSIGTKKSWTKPRIKPQKQKYYDILLEESKKEGYTILTTLDEYLIGDANVKMLCKNNHEFTVTYKKWSQNSRCNICKNQERIDKINNACKRNGLKCLKVEGEWVYYECDKGHKNKSLASNIFHDHGCPDCFRDGSKTEPEYQIQNMLDLLNVNYSEHDRTKIDPYELDFYLQDFDIAIEFNGYPYHTEKYKDKNYHLNKTLLCNKKGIQLIHIFYDELENKPLIIFNRLKSILKKETKRIYARKCDIKEITHKEAKEFCEKYHLQGYTNSSVKLGLYYKNELVSLMTFSKYSISKGSNNKDFSWELSRFCSKSLVVGGASKLLKHFCKNYKWIEIMTFADRRWSNGNLYNKLGFEFISYTKPSYWYIDTKNPLKRIHRFTFRKDKIKHLGEGSEWDIMKNKGFTRIWDCGNYKFVLKNPSLN